MGRLYIHNLFFELQLNNKKKIQSPCNRNCKLIDGFCTGCYRSYEEIVNWLKFSDEKRAEIMGGLANKKDLK